MQKEATKTVYSIPVLHYIDVEIVNRDTDNTSDDIVVEMQAKIMEGCTPDEAVSVLNDSYDCNLSITNDNVVYDEFNEPIRMSGEVKWVSYDEVKKDDYYNDCVRWLVSDGVSTDAIKALVQGDLVLATIFDNGVNWVTDVYIEEGYRHFLDTEDEARTKAMSVVKDFLYDF